jgi:hypothetical protein
MRRADAFSFHWPTKGCKVWGNQEELMLEGGPVQVKGTAPAAQWPEAARLLAQLESIKRVELSHAAIITDVAYDLVNSVRVTPDPLRAAEAPELNPRLPALHGSGSALKGAITTEQSPQRLSAEQRHASHGVTVSASGALFQQDKSFSTDALALHTSHWQMNAQQGASSTGFGSESAEASKATATARGESSARAAKEVPLGAVREDSSARLPFFNALESWPCAQSDLRQLRELQAATDTRPLTIEEAAQLDALFMRRIMALAGEAHFAGMHHVNQHRTRH